MNIDDIINQLRELYTCPEVMNFNQPKYRKFHDDLTEFIYQNNLQDQDEWAIISQHLAYYSKQILVTIEADTILIQLESLKRKLLVEKYELFWRYVHARIEEVSKTSFLVGEYANAVENAMKEVNVRVKKLVLQISGNEHDGDDLMNKAFTPNDPILIFEGVDTLSGKNVQRGYMQIFAGAICAIRNPKAHENMVISKEQAIKRLIFASLLMDKLDDAVSYMEIEEAYKSSKG